MKVLSLPMGADTGGVTASNMRAFDGEEGWEYRAIISTLNFISYDRDMAWTADAVTTFWQWADVIHLHHSMVAVERLRHGWKGFRLPHRPYVVEFHGTGFRENPSPYLAEMRRHRALGIVSTLDLYLLAPTAVQWIPCPVNVSAMQTRADPIEDDVIRIAHAPTNRQIKSTEALLLAVKRLQDEGHAIELDLIEGVTWDECLDRKAKADIYFDQVLLGYGNNAIEAWGMGIPVIAGAAPATLAEMERRFGTLPFYNATEDTIYESVKVMVTDPEARAEYAAKGLAHVRRFHDEKVVVEQLKDIYQRAAQQGRRRAA